MNYAHAARAATTAEGIIYIFGGEVAYPPLGIVEAYGCPNGARLRSLQGEHSVSTETEAGPQHRKPCAVTLTHPFGVRGGR